MYKFIQLHVVFVSFSETFYWFGDNDYKKFSELFEGYVAPPYKLPHMGPAYSFGVAGMDRCSCILVKVVACFEDVVKYIFRFLFLL